MFLKPGIHPEHLEPYPEHSEHPRNPAKYSPRTFAGVFARAFKTIDAMTLMNEIKKVIVRDIVRFTTFLLQIWIAKFIIILLTRLNI
jgi:hypothetical protein